MKQRSNRSIFKSEFTRKIILLTVLPIIIIAGFLLIILSNKINILNNEISSISKRKLDTVYTQMIQNKNDEIRDKVTLKLDSMLNEINILRADAQGLIDESGKSPLHLENEYSSWINGHMVYNAQKNWSNLPDNEFNVSISVWGYLHDGNGAVNQSTQKYISMMAPIIPVLQNVGENGTKKSWYYLVGPKETPIMIMVPWAQMPEIFDEVYPDHNTHNWWDFFFPGMVESWQAEIGDPVNKLGTVRDQLTVTPIYKDAGGTGLMVTIFAPLWNKERTSNFGAAAADYNISDLIRIVNDNNSTSDGFSFLMQSNGDILDISKKMQKLLDLSVLESRNSGVEISNYNLSDSKIKELSDSVAMLPDMKDSSVLEYSSNGKTFLISFDRIMNYHRWNGNTVVDDQLYLATILSKEEILGLKYQISNEISRQSKDTFFIVALLFIIFTVISAGFSVWYALLNTRQIRLIADGLTQIGEENFDIDIAVISKDELGSLAGTLNTITGEISKSHKKLEQYAQELEEMVRIRTVHLEEANHKLEHLSQIDGLTQIYNRRYFDLMLEDKWTQYLENQKIFSIILIDIDHFKGYNDCYGHQEGDRCLKAVANVIKDQTEPNRDMTARYGGEEFVVITELDLQGAYALAEKMRISVRALTMEHKFTERKIVTISLGVSTVHPSGGKDPFEVVKRSDIALYRSKLKGRDKVSIEE